MPLDATVYPGRSPYSATSSEDEEKASLMAGPAWENPWYCAV